MKRSKYNDFNITTRNSWFSSFLVSSNPISRQSYDGTTSSGIVYQLLDIYSLCRCCWNDTTNKWKVQNGKIEIICFVLNRSSLSISRCMLGYEADIVLSVVSFISSSMPECDRCNQHLHQTYTYFVTPSRT